MTTRPAPLDLPPPRESLTAAQWLQRAADRVIGNRRQHREKEAWWFCVPSAQAILVISDTINAIREDEAEDRQRLRDRLLRIHYPPQIGTHYEQGFADCMREVRKVLEGES